MDGDNYGARRSQSPACMPTFNGVVQALVSSQVCGKYALKLLSWLYKRAR